MITWLVVLSLLGLLAWAGRTIGGVRMAVSLVGLMMAGALAFKFGPSLQPLAAKGDFANPVWPWVLPGIVIFAVVYLVFLIIAQVAGLKALLFYKYHMPDERRVLWERMNSATGIGLGMANGVAIIIILGQTIWSLGYWTVQLTSPGENPALVRGLNAGHEMLRSSGLEKVVAGFDPLPDQFYYAADVAGVIYHNPSVIRRLASYPGLLTLAERGEFRELGSDPQFIELMTKQENLRLFLMHPKVQAAFNNAEIVAHLKRVDMRDLYEYLQSGLTDKYKDEKVLGRWELVVITSIQETGRVRPEMTMAEKGLLRKQMIALANDLTFVATPERKVYLKGSLGDVQQLKAVLAARPPGESEAAAGQKILLEGAWEKQGDDYQVTFPTDGGSQQEGLTILAGVNHVRTTFFGSVLVFSREE